MLYRRASMFIGDGFDAVDGVHNHTAKR